MTKNASHRPALESEHICVLYDPSSGNIVHTHSVAQFAGARPKSADQIEARCIAVAQQLGHKTRQMRTLVVTPSEYQKGKLYRVDVERRKLVDRVRQPDAGARSS